ncbi:CatB-related O-acetyltransferase [Agrobacterium tumefaciens]|uniref:CatB-related O-acetyltransferase n=1 Tax=Agrobacterium tumefaciens TaxID=358 RepID=UPI00045A2AA3|nr:CatB-related O-acetyltransferase [Agrobacterium tumefaciens]CDN96096.1 Acetyltransferase [Agrobacterium tumefaciens]
MHAQGSQIETDGFHVPYKSIRNLLAEHNIQFQLEKLPDQSVMVVRGLRIEPTAAVHCNTAYISSMGYASYSNSQLGWGIQVGRYCSIAGGLKIFGERHFPDWISTSPRFLTPGYHGLDGDLSARERKRRNIIIGNDVWIGAGVTLSNSVTIGDGAVVAANATVVKDVAPFTIVGGTPARVIRPRFDQTVIARIQKLQWWRFRKEDLRFGNAEHPEQFLNSLDAKISSGLLPYVPNVVTEDHLREAASA